MYELNSMQTRSTRFSLPRENVPPGCLHPINASLGSFSPSASTRALGRLRCFGTQLLLNQTHQIAHIVQRFNLHSLELDLHPDLDGHNQVHVVRRIPVMDICRRRLRGHHKTVVVKHVPENLRQLAIDAGCVHASPFNTFICVGRGSQPASESSHRVMPSPLSSIRSNPSCL